MSKRITTDTLEKVANKVVHLIYIHRNRVPDLIVNHVDVDPVCDRDLIKMGFIGRFKNIILYVTEQYNKDYILGVNYDTLDLYVYDIVKDCFEDIDNMEEARLLGLMGYKEKVQEEVQEGDHAGMIQNPIDGTWKFF